MYKGPFYDEPGAMINTAPDLFNPVP
jgi:hypothetical protein